MAEGRPGRGGITRGRADAHLALSGDTQGGTDAFQAKKLPPGRVPPRSWEGRILGRAQPRTGPVRETGEGSAGQRGSGEAAWHRRLAPHHRRAVRRYFAPPGK